MEMERINENLIKVYIDTDDLDERGIDFLELIQDQRSVEKFFYSILEEVDVERQFSDSEAITFQVIPSSNGIELYISRTNMDDMDAFFEETIARRLREHKAEMEEKLAFQKMINEETGREIFNENGEFTEEFAAAIARDSGRYEKVLNDALDKDSEIKIVRFNDLESFIQFAREEKDSSIVGDLYAMQEQYFFVIKDVNYIKENTPPYYTIVRMMDFGEPHHTTVSVLKEYGQLIHANDAIDYFGTHF